MVGNGCYRVNEDNSFIFQGRVLGGLQERISTPKKQLKEALANETKFALLNKEVFCGFHALLSQIETDTKDGGGDISISAKAWGIVCSIFEPILKVFGIRPDESTVHFLGQRKRKSWLASVLSKLLNRLFRYNLSWQGRLVREIRELNKKIDSGKLSKEDVTSALEKLEFLHRIKLEFFKCQISAIGIILEVSYTLLGLNKGLANSVVCTARSLRKAESTFSQENTQAEFSDKVVEADRWVRAAEYAARAPLAGCLNHCSDKQMKDALLPVDQLFSSILWLSAALAGPFNLANQRNITKDNNHKTKSGETAPFTKINNRIEVEEMEIKDFNFATKERNNFSFCSQAIPEYGWGGMHEPIASIKNVR